MTGRLHMIYLPIGSRDLAAFGRAHGLGGAWHRTEPDQGYMLHALLAALFGELAPKPFVVERPESPAVHQSADRRRDLLPVLAYSAALPEALTARADAADAEARACVDWRRFAGRPMPTMFEPGTRLHFAVTACPVVRVARGATDRKPGSEVDAYLAALDRIGRTAESQPAFLGDPRPVLDRAEVYAGWLKQRLVAVQAAHLLSARVVKTRRERLFRRAASQADERPQRKLVVIERPVARIIGTLQVETADAFAHLIARGIGRHRAFGFGMLLLRPAR